MRGTHYLPSSRNSPDAVIPKFLSFRTWKKQIEILTSVERGSLITYIMCMIAEGSFISLLFLSSQKRSNSLFRKGVPPESVHPLDWIQTNFLIMWFRHFLQIMNPSTISPALLILDDHTVIWEDIELIYRARVLSIPKKNLGIWDLLKSIPLNRSVVERKTMHAL